MGGTVSVPVARTGTAPRTVLRTPTPTPASAQFLMTLVVMLLVDFPARRQGSAP